MASLRVSGTYKTNFIVFKLLQSVPLINIAQVSQEIQISIPTINAAFDRLQELGIVREITDRQRDKLYSYERLYQSPLERVDTNRWRIPTRFHPEMRVPGMVYADDTLIEQILHDNALHQVANVATLPVIVVKG